MTQVKNNKKMLEKIDVKVKLKAADNLKNLTLSIQRFTAPSVSDFGKFLTHDLFNDYQIYEGISIKTVLISNARRGNTDSTQICKRHEISPLTKQGGG